MVSPGSRTLSVKSIQKARNARSSSHRKMPRSFSTLALSGQNGKIMGYRAGGTGGNCPGLRKPVSPQQEQKWKSKQPALSCASWIDQASCESDAYIYGAVCIKFGKRMPVRASERGVYKRTRESREGQIEEGKNELVLPVSERIPRRSLEERTRARDRKICPLHALVFNFCVRTRAEAKAMAMHEFDSLWSTTDAAFFRDFIYTRVSMGILWWKHPP